jgi:hypothetical protein
MLAGEVWRTIRNQQVVGSNPTGGSRKLRVIAAFLKGVDRTGNCRWVYE